MNQSIRTNSWIWIAFIIMVTQVNMLALMFGSDYKEITRGILRKITSDQMLLKQYSCV
ncbi:hypothetical protein QTP88_006524 [Uroleucon formosanum]